MKKKKTDPLAQSFKRSLLGYSKNVKQAPTNWPAFMAEQMRNIPPIVGNGTVPPPMAGQLGRLGNIDSVLRAAAGRGGPRHPFARYVLTMPDQSPYDPTYDWDLQHR